MCIKGGLGSFCFMNSVLSYSFIKTLRGMYHDGDGKMDGEEQCREEGGKFRKLCWKRSLRSKTLIELHIGISRLVDM